MDSGWSLSKPCIWWRRLGEISVAFCWRASRWNRRKLPVESRAGCARLDARLPRDVPPRSNSRGVVVGGGMRGGIRGRGLFWYSGAAVVQLWEAERGGGSRMTGGKAVELMRNREFVVWKTTPEPGTSAPPHPPTVAASLPAGGPCALPVADDCCKRKPRTAEQRGQVADGGRCRTKQGAGEGARGPAVGGQVRQPQAPKSSSLSFKECRARRCLK